MISHSLSRLLSRHPARKSSRTRTRFLPAEWLEPRTMLSGSGLAAILPSAMYGTPISVNTAPTVAQAISVNNGAAVTGKSAAISVLGSDDHGESNLTYTWTITGAPSGGTASFNLNGTNAAKSAIVTFTVAGTYGITVKIVDAGSLSVTSTKSAVVSATLTGLRVTAASQVVNPSIGLTVSGISQILAAQGLDQFGNAMATTPTMTWSVATRPSGAAQPVISASGSYATITFSKAGSYGLTVQAGSGSTAFTSSIPVTVTQMICSIRNASTAPVTVTGTTVQLAVPTFIDQFGNALVATPALTWSIYSHPQGAPAVTFTASGGVTTATFGLAGNYYINSYVTSMPNASFVDVIAVSQTLTSFTLTPNTATVLQGCNQQFTAQAFDQFRQAMTGAAPSITWTATAGTISTAGLFTAPSVSGTSTIKAQSGLASGTATVTVQGAAHLQNAALAALVTSLDADGSINRADMIQILRSVASNGPVTTTELSDLKLIMSESTTLKMPSYVAALASDVINGNVANTTFQGQALGNLTVGSSATQLNNLIGKWFLGTDLPALCNTSLVYKSAAGSLFPHTPSHTDEYQGMLGDCYFISALGTLADSNPVAVENMFIDNGDGTFTVRFYTGPYGVINDGSGAISAGFTNNVGTADYVTVNRSLPVGTTGILAYADYGSNYANTANSLWIPLAEKAYAQWNQTGKEGRDGLNAYASIQGGWMATVDAQVLGHNATDYIMTSTREQVAITALAAKQAVTIGTQSWSTGTQQGLYPSHAYAITAYNATTDTFTLYNPWGSSQPGQLTWSQLQATCTQLAVCSTSGSVSISGSVVTAGAIKVGFVNSDAGSVGGLPSSGSVGLSPARSAGSEVASAGPVTAAAAPTDFSTVSTAHWELVFNSIYVTAEGVASADLVDATIVADGFLAKA